MTSLTFSVPSTPQNAWRLVRRGTERAVDVARAPRLTAPQLTVVLVAVLAIGIGMSVLTTTDRLWWRLHFSELGTAGDFSGMVFNGTLILAGCVIVVFALRVRSDLRVLAAAGHRRPRLLVVLMISGGGQLAVVGMVPVDTLVFIHDRAASGVMLCFAGLLVSVAREWLSLPATLRAATALIAVALGATTPTFLTGMINLTAFEAIGFSLIFVWLGVFTTTLDGRARQLIAEAHESDPPAIRLHADAGPDVIARPLARAA